MPPLDPGRITRALGPIDDALLGQLRSLVQGRPAWLDDLWREWRSDGVVVQRDGRWAVAPDARSRARTSLHAWVDVALRKGAPDGDAYWRAKEILETAGAGGAAVHGRGTGRRPRRGRRGPDRLDRRPPRRSGRPVAAGGGRVRRAGRGRRAARAAVLPVPLGDGGGGAAAGGAGRGRTARSWRGATPMLWQACTGGRPSPRRHGRSAGWPPRRGTRRWPRRSGGGRTGWRMWRRRTAGLVEHASNATPERRDGWPGTALLLAKWPARRSPGCRPVSCRPAGRGTATPGSSRQLGWSGGTTGSPP